jgi:hypothetical protein
MRRQRRDAAAEQNLADMSMRKITVVVLLAATLLPCGCLSAGEKRSARQAAAMQATKRTEFCWPLLTFRYSLNRPTGAWLAQRGRNAHHLGVDMFAPVGQPVRAIADGVVHDISTSGWGGGNIALMIRHRLADGRWFIALYGHVRNIYGLRKGSKVQACSTIALIGPYRCGSHVHLGIIAPGRLPHAPYGTSKMSNHNNFINPVRFLQTGRPEEPGQAEEPAQPLSGEQSAAAALSPQCAGQNLAEGSPEEDELVASVLAIEDPVSKNAENKTQAERKRSPPHAGKTGDKISRKERGRKKAAVKAAKRGKSTLSLQHRKGRARHHVSAPAQKQRAAKRQSAGSKGRKMKRTARQPAAKRRAARKR